jgi:cbb3-type cytochrome oxidase cytochrome c subunit
VADERATFAAARRRLWQERRDGVHFVGRDLRHDAQNRLALWHRVHLLSPEKIFVNALNSPALPLPTFRSRTCHLAGAVADFAI